MSDEEPTVQRSLVDVTADLGSADAKWKTGEKDRKKYRDEFFTLATETLASKTLARKTISVGEFESVPEAEAWIDRHYPTWRLVEIQLLDDESDVVAILEEDPGLQGFVFANPVDGKVYQRQIVSGGSLLDDETLREDDPELWERITFLPEPEPQIKAEDEIDAEDLAKMQKYTYLGPPQVKLPAPRKATEEELQDDA